MELAGFLFTCSTWMVPMIQNTHYISLERSFQWEFSAIEIVRSAQYLWSKLGINLEAILTRLYLAFPISHQPHYRFPSSLISTESPYPGRSSDVDYEVQGRVSTENVGDYRKGPLRIKFRILLPS